MARLVFRNGAFAGKGFTLPANRIVTLGRNRDLDLPLPDLKLSRRHCQIEAGPEGFVIRDLESTNGTYLNGHRVEREEVLHHFDHVIIGDTEIEFQSPEGLDALARPPAGATEDAEGGVEDPAQGAAGAVAIPVPVGSTSAASGEMDDQLRTAIADLDRPVPPDPGPLGEGHPPPVIFCDTCNASLTPIEAETGVARETSGRIVCLECCAKEGLPALAPKRSADSALQSRPQILFCDRCQGSIPIVDFDLGIAKEIGGQVVCRVCIGNGISVGATPAVPAKKSQQDLDEILKGLSQVEEIPEPAVRPLGTGSSGTMNASTPARPAKPVPSDLEELEELGAAPQPAPKNAAPAPSGATPSPAPPRPPPRQPQADDDDLVEIGPEQG